MRAPPLPKGVHEKVVGTVLAPAPPSAMRVLRPLSTSANWVLLPLRVWLFCWI